MAPELHDAPVWTTATDIYAFAGASLQVRGSIVRVEPELTSAFFRSSVENARFIGTRGM
jgi:hypothetical protein